jgi:hypothetical protein
MSESNEALLIRSAILKHGFSGFADWARFQGYSPSLVRVVAHRYLTEDSRYRAPYPGSKTANILAELRGMTSDA